MPVIPTFGVEQGKAAADAAALHPSDIGIDALTQAARNISRQAGEAAESVRQGYNELGTGLKSIGDVAEQHASLQEISSMMTASAGLKQGLNNQYQAASASGNPAAMQGFRDHMEDQLDNFTSAANTPAARRAALEIANQTRQHFTTAEMGDASLNAGHAVITNLSQTVNTLADQSATYPQTLDSNLNLLKTGVSALAQTHNLAPELQGQLSTTLFQKGAAQMVGRAITTVAAGDPGANIPSNPEAARDMVHRYSQYLDPEMQTALLRHANLAEKVTGVQNQIADQQQQQAFDVNSAMHASNQFGMLHAAASGQQPMPSDYLQSVVANPNLTDEDKAGLIGVAKRTVGDPPQTNPAVLDQTVNALASGALKPNQIFTDLAAGHLSFADASWAIGQVHNPSPAMDQLNQNLQTARQSLTIDPGSGAFNPAGAAAYQRFQQWALGRFRAGEPIDPKQLPTLLDTFAPTGEDALSHIPALPDRPSLASILGGQ